jgi:hypothetical protein
MTTGEYTVILVHSTGHAIRAEKVLAEVEITCKLIPVPRHISSNCGVCVRVERPQREAARLALKAAGVKFGGIHEI